MAQRETAGRACPLCLGVDDPSSMIDVSIERANPPDAVEISMCRRCAQAIAEAVKVSDQPELLETWSEASPSTENSPSKD